MGETNTMQRSRALNMRLNISNVEDWFLGEYMRYLAQTWVPFICGGVVMLNLSKLIGMNPNYDASWWKVVVALALTVIYPLLWWNRH